MYRHHNVFLPIASLFICVPEQALGWFPLGLGLVMEDEPHVASSSAWMRVYGIHRVSQAEKSLSFLLKAI